MDVSLPTDSPSGCTVRQITLADREWIIGFLVERWGSNRMVAHGVMYSIGDLPGFIAEVGGAPTGLAVYEIQGSACEIVLIDSGTPHAGVGTRLVATITQHALEAGCTRLWVVTTNDNLDALRFYQRRGFTLAALRPNAVSEARLLKPEIPLFGDFGIALRDELELEMWLAT
jgi:GNAT superfamily N-acetyltransferase